MVHSDSARTKSDNSALFISCSSGHYTVLYFLCNYTGVYGTLPLSTFNYGRLHFNIPIFKVICDLLKPQKLCRNV